jgi:hypothetical protein
MSFEGVLCSKNFLTRFIEIYKEHPALRKIKSKKYTNKNFKNKAYSAPIEYCKLYYPEADRNFVSQKNTKFKRILPQRIKLNIILAVL